MQPGLDDRALVLRRHRLALEAVLGVLLLKPVDLDFEERLLLRGRLRGRGKEPDDLAAALRPATAGRGPKQRRPREPRAA